MSIDPTTLDPVATALAFERVPPLFAKAGRLLTLKANSFPQVVTRIGWDAHVRIGEAWRSVSYVLEKLREGAVEAWIDLLRLVPAGHVRIYDTRRKRASARRLGKPLECIMPFETCSPIEGTPLRFHVMTGGHSADGRAYTDAAIMIWYGPERGALRLKRVPASLVPSPDEHTLRLVVANGYDAPIPHDKP